MATPRGHVAVFTDRGLPAHSISPDHSGNDYIMASYRKRPVVIEAGQWFPPGDDRHNPAMLSHRKGNTVDPPDYRKVGDLYQFTTIQGMGDDIFMIRTPRGDLRVSPGDWIITNVDGTKYSCERELFELLHEPV